MTLFNIIRILFSISVFGPEADQGSIGGIPARTPAVAEEAAEEVPVEEVAQEVVEEAPTEEVAEEKPSEFLTVYQLSFTFSSFLSTFR